MSAGTGMEVGGLVGNGQDAATITSSYAVSDGAVSVTG